MGPMCKIPTCNYPGGQCEGWCIVAPPSESEDDMAYVDKYDIQKSNPEVDMVNHPPHYKQGGIECIDAIQAALTPEEFRGYCKAAALKYLWRLNHKGDAKENAEKAAWYLHKLISVL